MTKLFSLLLILIFVTLGFTHETQKPATVESTTALQSMVDTERAFAKMSEEQGIRPSFMAFIADDGILFRPGAVKGKQWMIDHPLPASQKRPLLSWQPTFADISLAGDMGYTTGPWQYKADIQDAQPVGWGNFLTVWKRQPDSSWKFVIDLGISNPRPDKVAPPFQSPHTRGRRRGGDLRLVKLDTTALLDSDRAFSLDSAALGAQKAFQTYAASEVRLFRNNKQPIIGKASAAAELPAEVFEWTWTPDFADVSRPADIGYSYGTYQIVKKDVTKKTTEKVESGNYYRIWKYDSSRLQGHKWMVVADLIDPVADPKKN
jgi:ketosteroid isomerase-like protein